MELFQKALFVIPAHTARFWERDGATERPAKHVYLLLPFDGLHGRLGAAEKPRTVVVHGASSFHESNGIGHLPEDISLGLSARSI